MTSKEWRQITAARKLLGLETRASLREVRRAYRRLSKESHPDLGGSHGSGPAMHELTEAYRLLVAYCERYPLPLTAEEADIPLEGEDWWLDRFGEDPLWGKG